MIFRIYASTFFLLCKNLCYPNIGSWTEREGSFLVRKTCGSWLSLQNCKPDVVFHSWEIVGRNATISNLKGTEMWAPIFSSLFQLINHWIYTLCKLTLHLLSRYYLLSGEDISLPGIWYVTLFFRQIFFSYISYIRKGFLKKQS